MLVGGRMNAFVFLYLIQIVMCVVFIACSVHTIHISRHTSMDGLSRDMSANWTSTVVP